MQSLPPNRNLPARSTAGRDGVGRRLNVSLFLFVLVFVLAILLEPPAAVGQPRRDGDHRERRRDFVEGLLRTLIDSQLDRVLPPEPGSPPGAVIRPPSRPATPQLAAARSDLAQFASESGQLAHALHAEAMRLPQVRPLIGDALRVNASAAALVDKCDYAGDLPPIEDDFRQLDSHWRLLSHRLQRTYGLGDACLQHAGRLNELDQALCRRFRIPPQIDRVELARVMASLASELETLLEDVGVELSRSPLRAQLLVEGRKVAQQAGLVSAALTEGTAYGAVVEEYKRFRRLWYPFAARLRSVDNRYLERTVRRVWQHDAAAHELLWLERTIDPQQLLHVTSTLRKSMDELFDRVTLNQLIELRRVDELLPIASELYGLCEYFVICVEDGEEPDMLAEAYRDIEEAWPGFQDRFRPIQSEAVQQTLEEIGGSVVALREALGLRPPVDRQKMAELAGSVENLAENLERDFQSYLRSPPYPGSFRLETARLARAFRETAHRLHANVAQGAGLERLRADSAELGEAWSGVHELMSKLQPREQMHFRRMSGLVAPTLVELQALIGL